MNNRVAVDAGECVVCINVCISRKRGCKSALAVCWVQDWAARLKETLLSSWDWKEDVVSDESLTATPSCGPINDVVQ